MKSGGVEVESSATGEKSKEKIVKLIEAANSGNGLFI